MFYKIDKNYGYYMWPGLQKPTIWAQKIADFSMFAVS